MIGKVVDIILLSTIWIGIVCVSYLTIVRVDWSEVGGCLW